MPPIHPAAARAMARYGTTTPDVGVARVHAPIKRTAEPIRVPVAVDARMLQLRKTAKAATLASGKTGKRAAKAHVFAFAGRIDASDALLYRTKRSRAQRVLLRQTRRKIKWIPPETA